MADSQASGPRGLVFVPKDGPRGDVLVLIHLRGGMDALHVIPPYADPDYSGPRPRLAVPPPGEPGGALDLDGTFGFHPALAPALDLYKAKRLAVVHACGSPDQTLSHFEAGRTLGRGVSDGRLTTTGWVARHLLTTPAGTASPLRAVALTRTRPAVLIGAPGTAVFQSLTQVVLDVPPDWGDAFGQVLTELYADGSDPVAVAGRQTLQLARDLGRIGCGENRARREVSYPKTKLGADLRQVARLIEAEVGLEVAVIDHDGWDSHIDQAAGLAGLIASLGAGLAAFATDLGDRVRQVTLVVVSEFGRRVRENSGLGTDHGRATAAFVMGGAVAGGRVYARWPGLHPDQLDANGNVRVTTDFRDVLAEIVCRRLHNPNVRQVFPGFNPSYLNLVAADQKV